MPEDVAYNDADEHEFFLVERARWSSIKKLTTGIGDQLNKACAAIEDDNPSIEGVLANIDFNSESRLGDAKNREGVLSRLIDHFSRIDLSNASLSEPDMLGRAYEYLIDNSQTMRVRRVASSTRRITSCGSSLNCSTPSRDARQRSNLRLRWHAGSSRGSRGSA